MCNITGILECLFNVYLDVGSSLISSRCLSRSILFIAVHDVFAYGSRLCHPCVQFAASVTKPSSDKIKEGSKWCTARWYVFFLANLTLSGVRNTNWSKDVMKQLRSHTVLLQVLLLVFTIETAHSRKEPRLQKLWGCRDRIGRVGRFCKWLTIPNSKHWFTTSFLQPLQYLVTP